MENNAAFRDPAALAACSQPADSSSPCGFTAPPSGDLAARSKHHLSRFVESQPPANYAVCLAQVQVSRHAAGADLAFELQAGQFAGRNVGGAVNVSSAATQAQALRTPIMQDILHYEKHHRQGLGASLREWNRLQGSHRDVLVPVLFTDEAGCKAHIVEWQKHQEWACPVCGALQRYWLPERLRFNCRCGKQYSALEGTIFYKSHVPLLTWFTTITFAVVRSTVTADEIARHVVTQRKQTIGDVLQPVHMTLSAADGNQRLAGVPQLLTDYLRKVSHLSREIEPQRITQENAK